MHLMRRKMNLGNNTQLLILKSVISNGTIHSVAPFMLQESILIMHSLTLVVLNLMPRSCMNSSRVQKMVPNLQEFTKISKEMEIYRMVIGIFGFDITV